MKAFVDFFTGMVYFDRFSEDILNGLEGGIHGYNIPPNDGIFDKEFLKALVLIQQGNNDFDYELGRIGYKYLTSDDGLKELAKVYLKELEEYDDDYLSPEIVENTKKSLIKIIK
jgi:hypothetical protein